MRCDRFVPHILGKNVFVQKNLYRDPIGLRKICVQDFFEKF
jgi:hypothetical protein